MHNKFMERAIILARENVEKGEGGPFGAVVVRDGRIIAEGVNQVTATNDPTAHAEMVAIRKACSFLKSFQLKDCTLYTSCEPCPMCIGAIYWAHMLEIFYSSTKDDAAAIGFDDAFIYEELKKTQNLRAIPMTQLISHEASEVFRAWDRKKNKINY